MLDQLVFEIVRLHEAEVLALEIKFNVGGPHVHRPYVFSGNRSNQLQLFSKFKFLMISIGSITIAADAKFLQECAVGLNAHNNTKLARRVKATERRNLCNRTACAMTGMLVQKQLITLNSEARQIRFN